MQCPVEELLGQDHRQFTHSSRGEVRAQKQADIRLNN